MALSYIDCDLSNKHDVFVKKLPYNSCSRNSTIKASLPCSQWVPLKSGAQTQTYPLIESLQLALLEHGLEMHSSISKFARSNYTYSDGTLILKKYVHFALLYPFTLSFLCEYMASNNFLLQI